MRPTVAQWKNEAPSLPSKMVVVPSRKGSMNKTPPVAQVQPITPGLYDESFDLLSESHDYSEHYLPMAVPRYTFSSNGRDFKFKPPPAVAAVAPAPSRKEHHLQHRELPALTNFPHHFASNSSSNNFTTRSHDSFDLTDLGYVEAAQSPPVGLPSPVVPLVRKQTSTGLQKLKKDPAEDWYIPRKGGAFCPRYCCCFFIATCCVLLGVALVVGSLYLAVKPKPPMLQMQNVVITNFKYNSSNRDGIPEVLAGMKFFVIVENPNKYASLIFETTDLELKYMDTSLGSISIAGFEENKRSIGNITAELHPTLTPIRDQFDATKLSLDVSNSNVQTDLTGIVVSRYKLWGIRFKQFRVPVDCKVNVKPDGGGGLPELISSSCYNYPT